MTVRERAVRASRIAAVRHAGVTWPQIAAEFGISVSQAQAIVADWQASSPADVDGTDSFAVLLATLRQAASDYAIIAQGAGHDSNRIGAIRGLVETAMLLWRVEVAAGLVPSSPAAPRIADQLQLVFREFCEILRRHNVSDEALRDFQELAERAGRLGSGARHLSLAGGDGS